MVLALLSQTDFNIFHDVWISGIYFHLNLHKTQMQSRSDLKMVNNLLIRFAHVEVDADRKAHKIYSEQKGWVLNT